MNTSRSMLVIGMALGVAACTALIPNPNAAEPVAQIDHIILGVNDLERGIAAFEKLTGVRPAYGGKHPGGTHNALVSLGEGLYLEIIAVQQGVTPPEAFADLTRLTTLTPVGWAASSTDLADLRTRLTSAGLLLTESIPGSRDTPDGATLSWHTLGLQDEFYEAPFFIVWSPDSPHPSATSPTGCTLWQWSVSGPRHQVLQRLRSTLSLGVDLAVSSQPSMRLSLSCPKGNVTFESSPLPSRPDA